MPTPKKRGARGESGPKGKRAAKGGRPKAIGAKPATQRKRRAPVLKKGARAEAKQAAKAPAPPVTPVVPKAVSAIEERKEGHMAETKELTPDQFLATVLVPQFSRDTGHMCWDCKHFRPVLKGSKFPPADTIGWCTMIHWPFYWCLTDFNVVKKCYVFDKGVYTTKKF
jgi:hypothetical protein